MALAVLRYSGKERGFHVFDVDIGHNRYFRLAIGAQTRRGVARLRMVDAVAYDTGPLGPVPASRRGRARVRVPAHVIDRENRFAQLISARDARGNGPAVSDVVKLRGRLTRPFRGTSPGVAKPPPPATAKALGGRSMTTTPLRHSYSGAFAVTPLRAGQRGHGVKLREGQISNAAGVAAIGSMLTSILPQVVQTVQHLAPAVQALAPAITNVVGSLLSGGRAGGAQRPQQPAAPASADLSRLLADPNLQRLLQQLVQQAVNANQGARAPARQSTQTAEQQGMRGRARALRTRRAALSAPPDYSQAMVAPALLAALPALAPLLQQVLTPQTIQTVLNAPNKHMGTIINGLKDFANLGIKSHEQDLSHLRKLNPGVDDPALDALLQSLSLSLGEAAREEPAYKRARSVRLTIDAGPALAIHGIETPAYRLGQDWGVPLGVETPKAIKDARVHLFVKDAETLEILLKARGGKGDVAAGPLPQPVRIPAEALDHLRPGRRHLLCAHLVWRNSRGQKRGTSIQQEIRALPRFAFERVGTRGDTVPLADPGDDRAFWHKIWTGAFDHERRKYAFDTKVKVAVVPGSGPVDRRPSRLGLDAEAGPVQSGALKARMDIPISVLLALREELDPAAEAISPDLLDALSSSDFIARMTQVAKRRLEITGLAGKQAAVWTYLSVKLGTVVLLEADNVDALGRVTSVVERQLDFPIPTLVNFAGYRTARRAEDDGDEAAEATEAPDILDGMKKVFDHAATLAPVPMMAVAQDRDGARAGHHERRRRHAA